MLPWKKYMLTVIAANTYLNIIVAAQDTEAGYQTSSAANDIVTVLVFRKYFVCGVNWGAPEMNMSDFAIFEKGTQRSAPELFNPLKYYTV